VAANPECVDELLDARRLVDGRREVHMDVGCPANGLVGDAEGGEDLLIEVVLADQALVHDLQELAGTGTLDHPVVIGGGQGDRLADTQVGEGPRRRALELGRVLEGSRADDAAGALHQAGNRMFGTDASRVGQ
jgi:hypothetical protein